MHKGDKNFQRSLSIQSLLQQVVGNFPNFFFKEILKVSVAKSYARSFLIL
jgi:hypothetical protein